MDKLNKILKEEAIFEGHSVEAREAIMEHVKRGVPLCDSIFRTHSDAYFETFNLARKLYKEGLLEGLDWESVEMLESNIGETAVVDGEVVYLDVPYLCEDDDDDDEEKDLDETRPDKMTTDTKEKERRRAEHFRLRDYGRHEDDEDAEERKERRKEQMSGYDDDELDRIKKLSKS